MTYTKTRTKGVYKTPAGTYRFRKMTNGKKISKYFTKYLEAVNFKRNLNLSNNITIMDSNLKSKVK